MIKKFSAALTAVLLLLSVTFSVHAMESPDLNRKGSLTLLMEWNGEKLNSGTLTICRVGQITSGDAGWEFALIPELEEIEISQENLNDVRLAVQLRNLAKEKALPMVTVPVQDGKAVFADLDMGLYLVTQEAACQGLCEINPFLISLPRWENDRYLYDLTAQPKVALESMPTTPPETEPPKPPDPSLPQTGQLNWPVPVMAVSGLALFALGWYLCYGKKKLP